MLINYVYRRFFFRTSFLPIAFSTTAKAICVKSFRAFLSTTFFFFVMPGV